MAPLGLRQAGLLLWVSVLGCVGTITGQTVPFFDNRTSINVCTSETTPMVSCAGQPDDYSGFELALFASVRRQLGWEDSMINLACYDWDTVVDHLAADDGVCDIAVAGINVATEYLDRGISFSFPTFRNGLRVMVAIHGKSVDYWAFMNAFSWEVWMAIVLTALVTATILWGIELWATMGEKSADPKPSNGTRDLAETMWLAVGRPMQASDLLCQSFAANLIVIVYAFLILIMVTLYTANTAANITAIRLESTIHGLEDLPGKAVGTWEPYVPDLRKKGIAAYGFPWNNADDERAMADALRSGRIQALILDASFLEYISADDCSLMLVGETFHLFDQAVAFPRGFNNSDLVTEINTALVELQENGESEDLISEYISLPQPSCKTGALESTSTAITFSQVAGLWILLGASVGVAIFLAALHQFAMWNTKRVARSKWYKNKKLRMSRVFGRVNNLLPRSLSRGRRRDSSVLDDLDLREPTTPKVSFLVPYGSAKEGQQQHQPQKLQQDQELQLQGAETTLRQALDVLQWLQQEQQRHGPAANTENDAQAAQLEALAAETSAARTEAEELQQRLRVAEEAHAEVEAEASLLRKELEALQMKASRPQGSAAAMRSAQAAAQTAAVAAAAEQLQGQVEQLEEELTRLQQDKSELGAKVEILRQENALLQDNLALARDERDQLMDVLNEREEAADAAQEEEEALELQFGELRELGHVQSYPANDIGHQHSGASIEGQTLR